MALRIAVAALLECDGVAVGVGKGRRAVRMVRATAPMRMQSLRRRCWGQRDDCAEGVAEL